METELMNALSILIVGMVTVFLILWLVVIIGNVLIRITNRFSPVAETNTSKEVAGASGNKNTIAAIVAAVDTLTNGKGKVTNIKKV